MEHFLERIALLRHWYSKSNEKSFSSELTYQSLNRALPSRKCSIKEPDYEKTPFTSCRESAINKVLNDWALN